MPRYDWWILAGGQWKYLGRFKADDWAGLWAQVQFREDAQLFTRLAPMADRF